MVFKGRVRGHRDHNRVLGQRQPFKRGDRPQHLEGSYLTESLSFDVTRLGWTTAECPSAGLDEQETVMEEVLFGAYQHAVDGQRLIIVAADARKLVFEREG